MEFIMAVQQLQSDRVDEYLLPVPVEGTGLSVNIIIDGPHKRPTVGGSSPVGRSLVGPPSLPTVYSIVRNCISVFPLNSDAFC